jgi:hypothetical protein
VKILEPRSRSRASLFVGNLATLSNHFNNYCVVIAAAQGRAATPWISSQNQLAASLLDLNVHRSAVPT